MCMCASMFQLHSHHFVLVRSSSKIPILAYTAIVVYDPRQVFVDEATQTSKFEALRGAKPVENNAHRSNWDLSVVHIDTGSGLRAH